MHYTILNIVVMIYKTYYSIENKCSKNARFPPPKKGC